MDVQLIDYEARDVEGDLAPLLADMQNNYHRAMWLFLNPMYGNVDLFNRCHTFHQLHGHTFSESHRRRAVPTSSPSRRGRPLPPLRGGARDLRTPGQGLLCHPQTYPPHVMDAPLISSDLPPSRHRCSSATRREAG